MWIHTANDMIKIKSCIENSIQSHYSNQKCESIHHVDIEDVTHALHKLKCIKFDGVNNMFIDKWSGLISST